MPWHVHFFRTCHVLFSGEICYIQIMHELITLTDSISYLTSSREIMSCEVIFIKDGDTTWIFDTSTTKEAADIINAIPGKKNIVISHWHPDHTANLRRLKWDNLYVSRHTKRYTWRGTVISETTTIGNVTIMPLPSSHAKGCLCLISGDYAFMGDGTYCVEKKGNHHYNVQLLQEEIAALEQIPARYVGLDHDPRFIQELSDLIILHKQIFDRRQPGCPTISVEDFFKSDGKVDYEARDGKAE